MSRECTVAHMHDTGALGAQARQDRWPDAYEALVGTHTLRSRSTLVGRQKSWYCCVHGRSMAAVSANDVASAVPACTAMPGAAAACSSRARAASARASNCCATHGSQCPAPAAMGAGTGMWWLSCAIRTRAILWSP